jgi:hypothetical protein
LIDFSSYNTIIEPSAGAGSFSKQIPGCIALDIHPETDAIIKADFLKWKPENKEREKTLVIGNPPFGKQCSLALKFIKHASTFASTIAFILPKSFKKESIQSKIPLDYHLISQVDIADNSFQLEGKDYSVPCVFQIWKQTPGMFRKKESRESLPKDMSWTKDIHKANIAIRRVGVYAGKAFKDDLLSKSPESHYFLISDGNKCQDIVNKLNAHIWQHNNTTGPRSISKKEFTAILKTL